MQTEEVERWVADGEKLIAREEYTRALVPLDRVVRHAANGPLSSKAWRLKSKALVSLGRLDHALTAANHALRNNPTCRLALTQRAHVYELLLRYHDACADYEQALQTDADDARLWLKLGHARLNGGNAGGGLDAYEHALVVNPESPEAWYGKGLALERLHRRKEALASYERAVRFISSGDANHGLILNGTAALLVRMRRPIDALALAQQVHALDTSTSADQASAWRIGGDACIEQRRYADALAQYEQSLSLEPEHPGAWYGKGLALHKLDRIDEAIAAYEETLRLDPNFPYVRTNHHYARAHWLLSQTPPLDPDAPEFAEIDSRKIWIDEARWFAGNRRLPELEAALNQALRLDPGDRAGYLAKAFVQLLQRRYHDAWVTWRQAWRPVRQRGERL